MGLQARLMSQALRKLAGIVSKKPILTGSVIIRFVIKIGVFLR
jgi:RecA/RadA recombinase